MLSRITGFSVLVLLILVASGSNMSCVTMGKYNALKDRVATIEDSNKKLKADTQTLSNRLDNFKKLSDKEHNTLRKRIAELAADFSDLQRVLARVKGRQEEVDFKLGEVAKRVTGLKGVVEDRFGIDSEALPEELPEEPKAFFQLGKTKFESGLTRMARAIFREFVKRWPDHELADDAVLMKGETLFKEGRFTESIDAYRKVYEEYQEGDRYKEAVLRIGLAYVRSNRCKKALKIYRFAASTFRNSETGKKARKEAKALEKICR